jgi:putative tryptophan/tyrosine transport system substrate-binding protein
MMLPNKSSFLLLLCMLFGLCACDRQQEREILTIGIINFSPAAEPAYAGFRQGMEERGYEEGRTIRYLYQGHIVDKQKLIAEGKHLVTSKVDLIFSMSTPATLVAQEVTANSEIPVVFGPVSNPVKSGLVASLKHPGSNLTGVSFSKQEPKRLEFLKMLKPSINRICFPYNPKDKSPVLNLQRLQDVAQEIQLELVPVPLLNEDEIMTFLDNFPEGFDAIYLPTDALMAHHVADFARVAISHKIPLSPPQREGVVAGGLASYGFSIFEVGRQAARLADQILHGTSPADLPVEMAEFVASINMSTAKKIDITIANSILRQAVVIRD